MSITHWLQKVNITQRELAKRLGYTGNGFVTLVNTGKRSVPAEDIPKWADALRLDGVDRESFIDECAEASIPKWYRDRLAALELQVAELHAQVDQALLNAKKPHAK